MSVPVIKIKIAPFIFRTDVSDVCPSVCIDRALSEFSLKTFLHSVINNAQPSNIEIRNKLDVTRICISEVRVTRCSKDVGTMCVNIRRQCTVYHFSADVSMPNKIVYIPRYLYCWRCDSACRVS
jgi:hypothetical protein